MSSPYGGATIIVGEKGFRALNKAMEEAWKDFNGNGSNMKKKRTFGISKK